MLFIFKCEVGTSSPHAIDLNHIWWAWDFFLLNAIYCNGPRSNHSMSNKAESGRCGNYSKLWFFKCSVFTTLLTSHINHRAFKLHFFLFFLRFWWGKMYFSPPTSPLVVVLSVKIFIATFLISASKTKTTTWCNEYPFLAYGFQWRHIGN